MPTERPAAASPAGARRLYGATSPAIEALIENGGFLQALHAAPLLKLLLRRAHESAAKPADGKAR